jgi:hypothetical protein
MSFIILSFFLLAVSRGVMAWREKKSSLITDGDAMGHLAYVKEFYKNKGKPISMQYKYILDGDDYPNGFHKIFYFFRIPVSWLEQWGGFLPTLFDLLLFLLVATSVYLYGGQNYEWFILFPMMRLLWGNVGRSSHFNERAYGVLFGNLYLFTTVSAHIFEAYWLLSFSILFFTVFAVSSKFTIQAITFLSALLSFFYMDLYFIATYVLSLMVSIALTRGYSYTVIKGVLRFGHFYKTYLSKIHPTTVKDAYLQLFDFRVGLIKYMVLLLRNSLLRVFTDSAPIVAIVIIIMSESWGFLLLDWYGWLGSAVILVLLISTKWLNFLGEPERYLEFALIPMFVILSFYSPSLNAVAFISSLSVSIIIIAFHFLIQLKANNQDKIMLQQDMIGLRKFVESRSNKTILTAPLRLSFFLGYNSDDNKFVTLFSHVGEAEKKSEYKWLCPSRYPWPRREIEAVAKRYQIDYFILNYKLADQLSTEPNRPYYDTSEFHELYKNDHFVVYSLR